MPGNPQGRDINEAGPKSVSLVAVKDDGSIHVEERNTSIAQFERVSVNGTGIRDWRELVMEVESALRKVRDAASAEHVIARLHMTGQTPLAWRIRRDQDLLKAEADDRATGIGRCWVEKLVVECRVPSAADGDDPVTELRRLIESKVGPADGFQQEAIRIVEDLRVHLPPESRGFLGSDEGSFREAIALLVAEGADHVLARLQAAAGEGEA
jgi:DNA repair exonuclease SbcCD nuclease subunit